MKPDDRALIAAFLETVAEYSQEEVEQRVPGITQSDMTRWRRDDWQRLSGAKRRSVQRWLDLQASKGPRSHQDALLEAARMLEEKAAELRAKAAEF